MDPRIVKFIKEHHVLTLATSRDNIPWAAHCFYAILEEENALVFTSDDNTRHASEMLDNHVVAGGIALETKVVGKIRGVQLTGTVSKIQDERRKTQDERRKTKDERRKTQDERRKTEDIENGAGGEIQELLDKGMIPSPLVRGDTWGYASRKAKKAYLKRFPYAALVKTNLWILELETIKFTDNRLGFGKKLKWERDSISPLDKGD